MRIISFSDFRSHTNQLFVIYNVLKFREIIKLNLLQLLSNFLTDSLPTDLKSLFKVNEIVHGHQTRQLFHVPSVDTSTYGINAIKCHGPVGPLSGKAPLLLIKIIKQMSFLAKFTI